MSTFLFAFLLAGVTYAAPSVQREAPRLPHFWHKVGHQDHVSGGHVVVRFALKQSNLDKLREIALGVSDPRSSLYGQHLSATEVRRFTAPLLGHTTAVEEWLTAAGVPFSRPGSAEIIEARLTTGAASELLRTRFHHAVSLATRQQAILAGDYWLPAEVHNAVAAVYGLHVVPAPPRDMVLSASFAQSVNVTPDVIRATYGISGVTPSGSTRNRQAVAAFGKQQTSAKDLQLFFKHYVPSAPAKDARVYKFVGDNGTGTPGSEAELDIEYIMGVAPGILTEFWHWDDASNSPGVGHTDLCAKIRNWTDAILKEDDGPLVHSLSYGGQKHLAELGCTQDIMNDVDSNFVKLAARGITIIVASGDEGSGWKIADPTLANTGVNGIVHMNVSATSPQVCAGMASSANITAWTYKPPAQSATQCSPKSGTAFNGTNQSFGCISGVCFSFSTCCKFAGLGAMSTFIAGFTFIDATSTCVLFSEVSGSQAQASSSSSYVPSGVCSLFETVTGTSPTPGATSGGDAVKPPTVPKLHPSWPASSPWVTAVGATRFVNHTIGQPEMASDGFGSGGGFSTMFSAFKDQADMVSHYLKIAPDLPPQSSFPAGGRATPDVSFLGEGYQIFVDGQLKTTQGTSASAPAFAAMVSLLNEARLKAGGKPMGYLNPFLYQNANAFTDITVGTDAIGLAVAEPGFQCTKGWDPVTGLGTPIFSKLLSAALEAKRTMVHV